MKKIELTFLAVLFISLLPQSASAQQLRYGVQAGFDLSSVYMVVEAEDGSHPELGYLRYLPTFNANFYLGIGFNEKFTLSFEPGVIRKGMSFNEKKNPFWYIQLPIGATYSITDKIHLTAGPEFSYLLWSEIERKFFKKIDAAVFAGASYSFTNNIEAGIKYSNSLNGLWRKSEIVITNQEVPIEGSMEYYHYYFQLFMRYKF